jgi:hypothetical protein
MDYEKLTRKGLIDWKMLHFPMEFNQAWVSLTVTHTERNTLWCVVMTMTMVCSGGRARQGPIEEAYGLPELQKEIVLRSPRDARIRGPYLKAPFSKLGHPHIVYLHPCPATIITNFYGHHCPLVTSFAYCPAN